MVTGCGDDGPPIPKLPSDAVLLAFGDSLTTGTGASAEQSYPSELERRIGREVVNAGRPGETSAQGLRRLPGVLDAVHPDLLILCHGGNDLLRRLDLGAAQANLQAMIALARERDIAVVLIGVPAPGFFLATASLYEQVAKDAEVPLESDIVAELLGDNRFKADAVHPNAAGYARMAQAVETLLRSHGAL